MAVLSYVTSTFWTSPGPLMLSRLIWVARAMVCRMVKSKCYNRLKSPFNFLLLLLSTAVVPPLTSVPFFLCAPPFLVRLHRSLPLIGSDQAGGLACPAEPNSAACRLRGMYSTAALPSLPPFNWLTALHPPPNPHPSPLPSPSPPVLLLLPYIEALQLRHRSLNSHSLEVHFKNCSH